MDEETFQKRLSEGDYTIALAPISAESGSVYSMLAQFTTAGGNLTGYANALYATQLEASTHATGAARCRLLGECERQLLSDCVAVPLFSQQKARPSVLRHRGSCSAYFLMPNNRRRIPRRHFGLLMTTTCILFPPFVL